MSAEPVLQWEELASHSVLKQLIVTYPCLLCSNDMYAAATKGMLHINPQPLGEAYLPSRSNCWVRLIDIFLFCWLDLNRNAAKCLKSLKGSDPHMAKLF